MIKLEFTDEDKKLLSYWRLNHLHPRIQLKMEVLWLKSQKLSDQKIAKLAGISANTVTKYIRDYQEGGMDKLKEIKFNRPESELKKHQKTIEEYFELNPPATINEASSAEVCV
jgi:transposase